MGLALSKAGFHCHAPLLPGHGESSKGMRSVVLDDWLEAVTLTYQAMRRDSSPVAVVGYCLGGTLALATARMLNPRGIVLLSAPVQDFSPTLFPPATDVGERSTADFLAACTSAKARAWRAAGAHPTVTDTFIRRFQEARARAQKDLSHVLSPVLIVRGALDPLISAEHCEQLARSLSSSLLVDTYESPQAGYALPIDQGRSKLFARVAQFLREVSATEESLLDG